MVAKTRQWASILPVLSGLLLALLPVAVMCFRFGVLDLQVTFSLLGIVAIGGVILLVVSVCLALVGWLKANKSLLRSAVISTVLLVLPVSIMGFQMAKATSVPPIHDITTDTEDPPVFFRAVELRAETENTLAYGTEELPSVELSALQIAAYPEIKTLHSPLSADAAYDRAIEIVRSHGLEVIGDDRENGIIEAVATTFWFGFKDDLVVRIRSVGGGSTVDLRSVSRVGKSDLGANAKRIADFILAFNQQQG